MSEAAVAKVSSTLKRSAWAKQSSPHQPLLWLAVLNRMCKGYITTNQIYFVEGLKKDFTDWLRQYKYARDHGQPSESIFHFRNSKIRKRKFTAGENDYYAILTTLGGGSIRVKRSIELAYLEDSIYEALMQAVPAQSFGAFLSCLYKMKAGEFLWQNELAHCFTRLSL